MAEVKGITKDRAYEIGEEFNEKWELWQIVGFLEKFGVSSNNSKKVYDELGKDAVEKIQNNPYILIDIVYGVDFNKIDRIALQLGIPKDNDDRIKSGIKYALLTSSYNGNMCVKQENLEEFLAQTLEVSDSEIENNIINLKVQEEIIVEEREDESKWVYLYPMYKLEKNIAERLIALKKFKNLKFIKSFEKDLASQEKSLGIKLSEEQVEAIHQINDNNVSIITGGPRNW